ncbi:hypothetical protein TTHERM_00071030 (macronuclear) [Tetrahymena thermophila SB210]|uniref:Uncharacterized protein n=1 Tax=Tetrahymena thermophila (strain SB210) TaxID=312017 RepID=I7M0H7_TETTS|nr:hypothetical protein TTHERM_00071030 [Tetrahymena thermophila SB210]EAR87596.3 hypothetical protein TTHERM_00071030 [Tetrahymena thermophila SB210]|eukprot:XP_001007841.3 hypothetical protein TTHERM_00071030 [Tetrahymena thermophila SB210]
MEYISDQALDSDKSIFTKQEHCDNPETHNGAYNRLKNGAFNYQKQTLIQGEGEQRGQPQNSKQNLQQKQINSTNDQSMNNMSSTYDNSNHNYTLSQQQQNHIHNDLDYFNHQYNRNQQENFQDFQEPPRNHTNKNNLSQANESLNEEKNFNSQEQAKNQDSQKQPLTEKVYNIATYELQPEIKGMIVALKYIGVPNHKVVEEIGKLGFTVSDSNVFMVWEEWTEERNKLGKSIFRDQSQALKASRGQYKKSNKVNRKFSGRQSSDEDEDIDYQYDDEEEDEEDSLNDYKIPPKNRVNKYPNDNRKNYQQSELESESYEFNENTTPLKGKKYSQLINFKEGKNYQPSLFDGDINRQESEEIDFDSDYDENYKKKLNESRKQNLKTFEKHPKKQVKMHGDHILFYNLEAGQCVFCAQNNKENEVYTTCMECEGQGENKFFICEECFDQNHSKQDQNHQNQQKQFVKNEDQEQPFIDTEDSETENHQKNLKNKKSHENVGVNEENNQNQNNQGKSNHPNNQETVQKEQKNNLTNQKENMQQKQKSDTLADEDKEILQKQETQTNETNYELNLIERIQKSQLKVSVTDDFAKSIQDNNDSPLVNKQPVEGIAQSQQMQNNSKIFAQQKKILKIYKNPQSIQQ